MRRLFVWSFLIVSFFLIPTAARAQAVLFDGLVLEDGDRSLLAVPASITADDYSLFGRFEYGFRDRVNVFGQAGARFNGGSAGVLGGGWAANLYGQSEELGVNIGIFNSYLFPIENGGPDALITIAPVFSRSWVRRQGRRGRITPYAGFAATILTGNTPPGIGFNRRTLANGLLGIKVTNIADNFDFVAEGQIGEESLFAFGFNYRF